VNAGTEGWTEATVYVVVKRSQDPGPGSGTGTALWQLSPNETLSTHYNYSDNNIYDSAFSNARKNTGDPSRDLSTNFRLYCVKSKDGDWTSYIDAIEHFHTATNTFSGVDLAQIGQGGGAGGFFGLEGDIEELIIYKAWHGDDTRNDVELYFSDRFPSLDLFEPTTEAILLVDNDGEIIDSNGIQVFITRPVDVVDNDGGDIGGVTL
jgi:hypothetical protein